METVRRLRPKLLIVAGATPCRQVFGRAVKITEMRGLPTTHKDFPGTVILPIYSGAHVRRVPEYGSTFNVDFGMVRRIIDANYCVDSAVKTSGVSYEWVTDIQFIIDAKPKILALDTEYTGGKWYSGTQRLLTIQLCYEKGKAYSIPFDYPFMPISDKVKHKLISQLAELLENPEVGVIGHAIKGDAHVIRTATGIRIANIAHDTLVMVHDINENMLRKNLDECIKVFVPTMAGYNDVYNHDPLHEGKSRMDLFPPEKMLPYGAGDALASFMLYWSLRRILEKDKLAWNCYENVRMKAYRKFIGIEEVGFYVDVAKLDEFREMLTEHQEKEQESLLGQIPREILEPYRNTGVGIKITRADILRDFLFTHPRGLRLKPVVFTAKDPTKPSTSGKAHFPYFTHVPFVVQLMDYLKNDKLLNTYVNGYYKYIFNGRVRPSYNLHITTTGRTASSEPNGQNSPKRGKFAKKFNEIFVAPKGWSIIDADFSQVELRIVADRAKEKRMIHVYKTGGDIHETTAAGVMNLTIDEFRKLDKDVRKAKRNQAKPVNFGFLYGMWWKKFKTFAKTDYGIDFTDAQAEKLRELFFTTYPALVAWHKDTERFIKKNGYIRSSSGKIRHLPGALTSDEAQIKEAVRQGINAPIQEFGNTLGLVALHYLGEMMPSDKFILCGYIHDDIIAYVRDDYLIEAADKFKYIMEHLPIQQIFGFKLSVPIVAEVAFGKNKAQTYEYADYYAEIKARKIKTMDQFLRFVRRKDLIAYRNARQAERAAEELARATLKTTQLRTRKRLVIVPR